MKRVQVGSGGRDGGILAVVTGEFDRGRSGRPSLPCYGMNSGALYRRCTIPNLEDDVMLRTICVVLLLVIGISGCSQYQLASLQNVEIPNYEPREVVIPPECEPLIARAAREGMARFSDAEAREVLFCQQQQIIRTQEEEAAAKRLEAHAAAARFALQTATFVLTSVVAVIAWVF